MPKLWTETIQSHRQEVHQTVLDAAWALIRERGLLSVTMSQIAEHAGIGRATLYKYFPDIEAVLLAWHRRHVEAHLRRLEDLRTQHGDPVERLEAVLSAYALICHHRARHGAELGSAVVTLLHRGEETDHAQRQLHALLEAVLTDATGAQDLRDDLPPSELASYCLHALAAAADLPTEAAVHRLVTVIVAGIRR